MLAACVTFHRPLYWRSKRNSPLDVRHKKIAGTRVHPALETQGEVWRCRRSAGSSVKEKIAVSLAPLFVSKTEHGGKQVVKIADVVDLQIFVAKLFDIRSEFQKTAYSWLK